MAVELRNALGTAVGRNLPATLLFDYPSVEALAEYLCKSVLKWEELSVDAAPAPKLPSGSSDLLDEIENLDDSEIERLLRQRRSEKT
jgi:hypothetical protein